jgi:hypothetical protein
LIEESFGQVSILPFHARWEEVRTKLLQADKESASQALKGLLVEVASSPDVTEADRLALIASYRSAFDQWSGVGSSGSKLMSFETSSKNLSPSVMAMLSAVRIASVKAAKKESDKSQLNNPVAINAAIARRAGFIAAIDVCGKVLETHFPRTETSRDELPDRIYLI